MLHKHSRRSFIHGLDIKLTEEFGHECSPPPEGVCHSMPAHPEDEWDGLEQKMGFLPPSWPSFLYPEQKWFIIQNTCHMQVE